MIQERAILKVADNSGAKTVRCFRVLGGSRKRYARIGEVFVASVQTAEPRKQVKKKDVVRCVLVRSRAPIRRRDGTVVRFDDNAAVIIEKQEPKGTRIFGPIPREIKEKGYHTIASLAEELV
ncbi:MAG: 50S ribosomal protein L14 [Candidatus Brennerbacteria bacterium]|nr:50S ribosomal protein L14 [Candidatus Brennerbacteria bacterium]